MVGNLVGRVLASRASLVAFAAMMGLAGCSEGAVVKGVARDNFGQPLAGVTVSMPSNDSVTVTGEDGAYTIPYRPGLLELEFAKDGYQPTVISVNATLPPLQAVLPQPVSASDATLYWIVTRPGLWVVGNTHYIGPVTNCQVDILPVRDNVQFGIDRYTAGRFDPAIIQEGSGLTRTFIYMPNPNNPNPNEELVMFLRDPRPEIVRVVLSNPPQDIRHEIPITPVETVAEFGEWFTAEVPPGTYAYVTVAGPDRLPAVGEACHLFAIPPPVPPPAPAPAPTPTPTP